MMRPQCPSPPISSSVHPKVGENFTQTDVDLNKIRYSHTTRMGVTQGDSFVFVLSDGTHRRHEETFEIKVKNSRK
ncbi:MAG: hypothetical protein DSZ07_03655, partial [Sulfurovum sp.]